MSPRISKFARLANRPVIIALIYIAIGGLWIVFSSLFNWNIDNPDELVKLEIIKGLVFVTLTGGLLYLLLKKRYLFDIGSEQTDSDVLVQARDYRPQTFRLTVTLASLFLLVPLLGYLIVNYEKPRQIEKTYDNLRAVAELKAHQVYHWLNERHKDGLSLARDPGFIRQVQDLGIAENQSQTLLRERLKAFRQAYDYQSVILLDSESNVLLQSGQPQPVEMISFPEVASNAHGMTLQQIAIFRDKDQELHLDFLIPMFDPSHPERFTGTLLLHTDPDQFLFPYLQRWTDGSKSGESLLVRKHEGEIQFINQPRFSRKQALHLAHPLDTPDLPAAAALRKGSTDTFDGKDYRGVTVLAAYHPVPGTDWQLIAKQDREEVLAPLYTLVRWFSLISILTLGVFVISLLVLWKQRRHMYELALNAEKTKTDRILRQFYDLPFIGMAITSPTTRKAIQFNDYICEIFGYNRDELATISWEELTHPDDLPSDIENYNRVLEGEADGYEFEKRAYRKDGTLIYIIVNVKAVRNKLGQLDYLVTTVQDITRRKSTELALQASEARLRTLIDSLPDLVWLKDTEGYYLFCNPMFGRFFGTSETEIIGKTDYDFVQRDQADFFRQHDQQAMLADQPHTNEETLTFRQDDYQGIFETIKTPIHDNSGNIIGILGTARDITERKQSEANIRQLNQIYATLSQTNEAIVRSPSENELLPLICQYAVELGAYRLAWIGFINFETGNIDIHASYGESLEYLEELSIRYDPDSPHGRGPTGIAIHTGEPYWCQDILNDPATAPWQEQARRYQIAASAALPLYRGGKVVGAFNLYASQTGAFDDNTRNLLEEMTNDISFALDNFDREHARKEAEKRLALVIEGSSDAPWDWDLVNNTIYYSPQWWEMIGYSPQELKPNADLWRQLAHSDDIDEVETTLQRIQQPGHTRDSVECRFRHRDGHYIPTLIRGILSRDEEGHPVRLTGTIMDLTERKRLEAERHASLERLEKISGRLPGMVYEFRLYPEGRFCMPYVSKTIREIFDLSPEQVKDDANKLFETIHPDDYHKTLDSVYASARELSPWRQDFRIYKRDNSIRWLSGNAVPQKQQDNSILWYGFVNDITERKADEAKLHLAADVFEQSREGIMITDVNNDIVMVNKAFSEITGYSENEVIGHNPRFLSSDHHDDEFYSDMWRSIDALGFWQGEIWNRRKDGSLYPEWLSITRKRDEHDNITGHIGVFEDITLRKEYEDHIHRLAHYDPLTGLPNRVLLLDRIKYALSIAQRENKQLALLYCDLDRFKNVNDALGHSIGDGLLTQVAERLLGTVRAEDTVSRQGGDEFVILLPDANADGAAHVAEKIKNAIKAPYRVSGYDITVSSSIGIALYPRDGDSYEMLAKNSDIAMYRAKQTGRDGYCFFTPELEHDTARTLELENGLQRATQNDEFELYYQPQISLADGSISGLEALLRWNHPEHGLLSPNEFIPIAENSGHILQVGEWVIRTAAKQLQHWLALELEPPKIAINLSVRQLKQPDLHLKLEAIFKETGLDANRFELELTESMLMEDQTKVIETLEKLNKLGLQLSIDDFGTGYSSLSYLKQLPVDQLKIDKTFVQDMLENIDNAIIARSVISLGHSLGLKVIAEGVETSEQLDFLRTHYCDNIQGYLFSKPLPALRVEQMISRKERMSLLSLTHSGKEAKTLLLVDDETNILNAIKGTLQNDGYNILTAKNGQDGLEILAKHQVCVIISDQRMPGMSGAKFLSKAKELYPDTIRIVLSDHTELRTITDAINSGDIDKFLTKPWDDELLRADVREAFQRCQINMENQRLNRELREANRALANLSSRKKK